MPSAVKTVFGVPENARIDTFEAFISGQFFARIWVMLMALYGIQTANALQQGRLVNVVRPLESIIQSHIKSESWALISLVKSLVLFIGLASITVEAIVISEDLDFK